jgi:hypothetical protein
MTGRTPTARKRFREMLTELLDDGTGQVCPGLAGLLEDLVSMPVPGRGSNWLRGNASAREYLRGLARGQFERWYRHELQAVTDPGQARLLRHLATWHRRLALLNRFLADQRIPLRTRVAGCLLLLYAQAVTRLVRLTVDDVIDHHGQVSIRLGDPPTPVPEPFAAILTELAANRANMNTAANPACPWLFPGGRAGQPLTRARSCSRSARSASPPPRPAPRRSASSCSRPLPRSSRTPSATTPEPRSATSSPQAGPGAATRPAVVPAERQRPALAGQVLVAWR